MLVLVDYDNIPDAERNRGVVHVVSKILNTVELVVALPSRVRLRLYGGWYEGAYLSRAAQLLSANIQAAYPSPLLVLRDGAATSVIVSAEMAYSLEIDPGRALESTYRRRSPPPNLKTHPLPYMGCIQPGACSLHPVRELLRSGYCPHASCAAGIDQVFYRPEQKLVDTMLTSDIIHAALSYSEPICVVSSDDDMWPGIKTALSLGAKVVHLHTRRGWTTRSAYARSAGPLYHELSLN